ncbi:hypothetical protein VTN00DRAFT_1915 [Thermoascus crustaceus]|uniref:uncharacterized protein n=1 Tax=Thermoascus crustaceus TaxID=5088 RepID=UPI0037420E71
MDDRWSRTILCVPCAIYVLLYRTCVGRWYTGAGPVSARRAYATGDKSARLEIVEKRRPTARSCPVPLALIGRSLARSCLARPSFGFVIQPAKYSFAVSHCGISGGTFGLYIYRSSIPADIPHQHTHELFIPLSLLSSQTGPLARTFWEAHSSSNLSRSPSGASPYCTGWAHGRHRAPSRRTEK